MAQESICVRMQNDGIDQQTIDRFFGRSTSVTPKLREFRLPDGLAPKPKIKPGAKMKQFQWLTLDPFKVQNSIWSECDEEKIDFDRKSLEAIFRQKQIKTRRALHKAKREADNKIHILEGKRSYNVEIFLSRLKIEPVAVRECLLKLDESICNAETAGRWKKFMPTPEEAAMFDGVRQEDVSKLARPETFFFTLSSIDKNLPERLELWEFKMNFDKIMMVERKKVNALRVARKCIQESTSLRVLLSTILAFGNHMNGGTNRGTFPSETMIILT